jgi:PPK2 family polyphosphate:nucleotide phosphotransferase
MDCYRIQLNTRVKLTDWDPNEKSQFQMSKKDARKYLRELNSELETLQELLFAEQKHRVLIVLQAMDTGGKDGTIRHVFEGVNPSGVRVASFKVPTKEELAHDYLWRVHKQTPRKGEIAIFNRSHYEDVLVVRVHNLVPEKVWRKRYEQINDFERLLSEEGTTILKFFLHIDKVEQKSRLQARLDDPQKRWKFSLGDLDERKLWPDYSKAYEEAIGQTSTEWAPWYIIPSNRKWYRNLTIAKTIIGTLQNLNMEFPQPADKLDNIIIE